MSRFDDFVERLEAALSDDGGREAFAKYLQKLTPEERAELLAEAERRDPEEQEAVKRFQALVKFLRERLTGIKVYKAGKVEKDVYVVGRTAEGDFAGVFTRVVET